MLRGMSKRKDQARPRERCEGSDLEERWEVLWEGPMGQGQVEGALVETWRLVLAQGIVEKLG